MLTEGIIASRNGRQVLPVKNTYRNKIAGVVHDISASGNTVYIEPREVVKLSEEIASLRADERYEMMRILQELSERVRPHAAEIANDAWIIGHLDLIRAKVRFIQETGAVVPQVSEDQEIQLLHVRHPLVQNAVANDVHFGKDLTAIVITGPNTGGKTIMLKTLGLTAIDGFSQVCRFWRIREVVWGFLRRSLRILETNNPSNKVFQPSLVT